MKPVTPVFLARAAYRLRRATDAARILPVLGVVLFLLPMAWTGAATSRGVLYLFGVWLGLIVLAAILSRVLINNAPDADDLRQEEPDNGSV